MIDHCHNVRHPKTKELVHIPGCMGCAAGGHDRCTCKPLSKQDAATLIEEIHRLRETISALNRRCQRAESAALTKVEEVRKAGPSLGRALAGWAAGRYRTALEEIATILGKPCADNHCEGCRFEMDEVKKIVDAVLKKP